MGRPKKTKVIEASIHKDGKQFFYKMGYYLNEAGDIKPKFFYLGKHKQSADWRAQQIYQLWKKKLADFPNYQQLQKNLGVEPRENPVWTNEEIESLTHGKGIPDPPEDPDADVVPDDVDQSMQYTIAHGMQQYLQEKRAEVGLRIGLGWYKTMRANLTRGLSKLATSIPIKSLTYDQMQEFRLKWLSSGKSPTTIRSYLSAVKDLFKWMEENPKFEYQQPSWMRGIFSRLPRKRLGGEFVPTLEQVQALLAKSDERLKLYILLAINAGLYPADIAKIRQGSPPTAQALTNGDGYIITYKDEPYVYWQRGKTRHQNDFSLMHWLFPEVVKLLHKYAAPPNRQKLYLLSEDSGPLHEEREKSRVSIISDSFERAKEAAKLPAEFHFINLRKFGATMVKDVAMDFATELSALDIQRMYRGESIPGTSAQYVRDNYVRLLTPVLKALHAKLSSLLA